MALRIPRLRTVAGVVTAAALAAASLAAPARAEMSNGQMLGVLGGIAAAGIVLSQMDQRRDRRDGNVYVYRPHDRFDDRRQPMFRGPDPRWNDQRGWRDGGRGRDWHDDRRDRRRSDNGRALIPQRCIGGARGGALVNEECYRGVNGRGFPDSCAVDVRTRHGRREAYDLRCLSREGYDVSRR
ncbi:hypothetical protein [Frigidibacter sp. MR17.24]|uniref:hypothetical protein n=1 Tax=Frigidibacter sp. MR17.24 TaxID=3127345 RepID=UPI003012D369